MPIPEHPQNTRPHRLLREVAFEKLLAAILDGTLEPGERLHDEELEKWLGVSRTPVRQAMTQLQSYGLIEIEAHRFTRVSPRDATAYAVAAEFLAGLHRIARDWEGRVLEEGAGNRLLAALEAAKTQVLAHDMLGPAAVLEVQGELTRLTGNALLMETEEPLRIRVSYLRPHEASAYNWDELAAVIDELAIAIQRQ